MKAPPYDGKPLPSIFSTLGQEEHRRLKSGVAQKYSMSSLLRLEPLVDNVTQNFIARIRQFSSTALGNELRPPVVDLGAWVQYYAFDVIGAITFSRTFGFLDTGSDYNGVIKGLEGGLKYAAVIGQIPAVHPWLLGNLGMQWLMGQVPILANSNPIDIILIVSFSSLHIPEILA